MNNIPYIPSYDPAERAAWNAVPPPAPEYTVQEAAAWLGLDWDVIEAARAIRAGGPLMAALIDAHRAQGTDTTPAQVLAEHDINPADPLAAVRAWDARMRKFDA